VVILGLRHGLASTRAQQRRQKRREKSEKKPETTCCDRSLPLPPRCRECWDTDWTTPLLHAGSRQTRETGRRACLSYPSKRLPLYLGDTAAICRARHVSWCECGRFIGFLLAHGSPTPRQQRRAATAERGARDGRVRPVPISPWPRRRTGCRAEQHCRIGALGFPSCGTYSRGPKGSGSCVWLLSK
jgi:hypothetical protein